MSAGAARFLSAIIATTVLTAGIGWLGRAPYAAPGSEAGLLRLSWRLRGERTEVCRRRTQTELDALPVHMRTPEVCEGEGAAYRLIVVLDDETPDTILVRPRGAKADRPLYVLEERRLASGSHRVRVEFARLEDDAPRAPAGLDIVIEAAAGRIELITMEKERLVHRMRRNDERS